MLYLYGRYNILSLFGGRGMQSVRNDGCRTYLRQAPLHSSGDNCSLALQARALAVALNRECGGACLRQDKSPYITTVSRFLLFRHLLKRVLKQCDAARHVAIILFFFYLHKMSNYHQHHHSKACMIESNEAHYHLQLNH